MYTSEEKKGFKKKKKDIRVCEREREKIWIRETNYFL